MILRQLISLNERSDYRFLKTHPKAVGVDTVDIGSMNRSTCMHTKLMSIQLVISIIIVTFKQEECDKEKAG